MEIDERYMKRALQLARLGMGAASPNPMVGAVVVHDGKIIGEGFHRRWGGPHAEVNAIDSVADKRLLADSTMYVTLEPCAHYGKTPPCAELLVKMQVPRVIVGTVDPFARVCGRGVQMLRDAGVEVVTEVLADECRELNRRFFTAHTHHRPYVMLKWAQSADMYMGANDRRVLFSNELSMMWMHRERSRCDAVLVGAGTVKVDNPALTVRRWHAERQPLRVVLDGRLSIPADCNLLSDGLPTIVYNNEKSCSKDSVEYVKIDLSTPAAWLADLYSRNITSVMIEGGACVLNEMIEAQLWDEARIETATSIVLGKGVKAPAIRGGVVAKKEEKHGDNVVVTVFNSGSQEKPCLG